MLKKLYKFTLNYCFLYSNNYKNIYIYTFLKKKNLLLFFEKKHINSIFNFKKVEIFQLMKKYYYTFITFEELINFYTLMNYYNKTYKTNRLIYNLYVKKKKTHSRTKKLKSFNKLFNLCFKKIKFFKQFKFSIKKISMLFYSEYINSIWYFNWWYEWKSSRNKRLETTRKNPFKKWKYDLNHLHLRRILHFITLKKKKKHNRRKFTTPKDSYNIGFLFGFTKEFFNKIFINLQQKPSKLKKSKKKKKKC